MTRRSRHRGYVLIVTLGLLVLSATMLVSLGRGAMHRSAEARNAVDELQQRWGAASCRRALLPHAEQILSHMEREQRTPLPQYRTSVRLGGFHFDLLLSDEQAKANVNAMLDQTDQARTRAALQRALSGNPLGQNIRIRPLVGIKPIPHAPATTAASSQPTTTPVAQQIESLGQLFNSVQPAQLLQRPGQQPGVAELITCWGGGAINLNRTSPAALKLAAGDALSALQIDEILRTRNKIYSAGGGRGSDDALQKLMKSNTTDQRMRLLWTLESKCHSLWVITRAPHREYHELAVQDLSGERDGEALFVW